MRTTSLFALLFLVSSVFGAAGPRLSVSDDTRGIYLVQSFCFSPQGKISLHVENAKIDSNPPPPTSRVGFVIMRAKGAYSSNAAEYAAAEGECLLDRTYQEGGVVLLQDSTVNYESGFNEENAGHYFILFVNCNEGSSVSYDLTLELTNNGAFLPAGDAPLPTAFGTISVLFFVSGLVFAYLIKTGWDSSHKIHLMMLVLVFVKSVSLALEAARYNSLNMYDDGFAWSTAVYIFAFLKGAMLFGILVLIGTGLFILKPFLSEKDKRIILFVIPLQCMVNVAMVVVEETPPGTVGWLTWRDILHLLDIVCCCAILFPIVWSIRHLREASHADGQAVRNLGRLRLFRSFYVMVVSYIYVTRIIVYLVRATLPCKLSWVSSSASELATLAFFLAVGYQFRPRPLNPYFNVEADLEEEGEALNEMDQA